MSDELSRLDATAQAELVRGGQASPLELVQAAIARIEKLNPELNAVIHPLFEKALAQAASPDLPAGPFRGVPFLVKDAVCHTAGDPYHCGMRFLKRHAWVEDEDTYLAQRFRRAGFVFVGKTNTPELAFSVTTEPLAYGPTRNPWDPSRSPGGSSGGTAAAVASGMTALGHGNDMGGSIRAPSSACGLVGLKPTRARASLGPDYGEFWWQLTHEHVLTRSVRDSAAVLDAIAGPAPGDPYTAPAPLRHFARELRNDPGSLRIGLRTRSPSDGEECHEDCRAAAEAAARLLESLGHHVEIASPEVLDQSADLQTVGQIMGVALSRDLERWGERVGQEIGPDDVEPTTWAFAEMGRALSATQYVATTEALHRAARALAAWWETGFDLLLTPTMGEPPPPIGPLGPTGDLGQIFSGWTKIAAFTSPFNVSGQPAISLPLHWNDDGLPIGVQLVAAVGREDVLIRVAAQLEQAQPWADRLPRIHA